MRKGAEMEVETEEEDEKKKDLWIHSKSTMGREMRQEQNDPPLPPSARHAPSVIPSSTTTTFSPPGVSPWVFLKRFAKPHSIGVSIYVIFRMPRALMKCIFCSTITTFSSPSTDRALLPNEDYSCSHGLDALSSPSSYSSSSEMAAAAAGGMAGAYPTEKGIKMIKVLLVALQYAVEALGGTIKDTYHRSSVTHVLCMDVAKVFESTCLFEKLRSPSSHASPPPTCQEKEEDVEKKRTSVNRRDKKNSGAAVEPGSTGRVRKTVRKHGAVITRASRVEGKRSGDDGDTEECQNISRSPSHNIYNNANCSRSDSTIIYWPTEDWQAIQNDALLSIPSSGASSLRAMELSTATTASTIASTSAAPSVSTYYYYCGDSHHPSREGERVKGKREMKVEMNRGAGKYHGEFSSSSSSSSLSGDADRHVGHDPSRPTAIFHEEEDASGELPFYPVTNQWLENSLKWGIFISEVDDTSYTWRIPLPRASPPQTTLHNFEVEEKGLRVKMSQEENVHEEKVEEGAEGGEGDRDFMLGAEIDGGGEDTESQKRGRIEEQRYPTGCSPLCRAPSASQKTSLPPPHHHHHHCIATTTSPTIRSLSPPSIQVARQTTTTMMEDSVLPAQVVSPAHLLDGIHGKHPASHTPPPLSSQLNRKEEGIINEEEKMGVVGIEEEVNAQGVDILPPTTTTSTSTSITWKPDATQRQRSLSVRCSSVARLLRDSTTSREVGEENTTTTTSSTMLNAIHRQHCASLPRSSVSRSRTGTCSSSSLPIPIPTATSEEEKTNPHKRRLGDSRSGVDGRSGEEHATREKSSSIQRESQKSKEKKGEEKKEKEDEGEFSGARGGGGGAEDGQQQQESMVAPSSPTLIETTNHAATGVASSAPDTRTTNTCTRSLTPHRSRSYTCISSSSSSSSSLPRSSLSKSQRLRESKAPGEEKTSVEEGEKPVQQKQEETQGEGSPPFPLLTTSPKPTPICTRTSTDTLCSSSDAPSGYHRSREEDEEEVVEGGNRTISPPPVSPFSLERTMPRLSPPLVAHRHYSISPPPPLPLWSSASSTTMPIISVTTMTPTILNTTTSSSTYCRKTSTGKSKRKEMDEESATAATASRKRYRSGSSPPPVQLVHRLFSSSSPSPLPTSPSYGAPQNYDPMMKLNRPSTPTPHPTTSCGDTGPSIRDENGAPRGGEWVSSPPPAFFPSPLVGRRVIRCYVLHDVPHYDEILMYLRKILLQLFLSLNEHNEEVFEGSVNDGADWILPFPLRFNPLCPSRVPVAVRVEEENKGLGQQEQGVTREEGEEEKMEGSRLATERQGTSREGKAADFEWECHTTSPTASTSANTTIKRNNTSTSTSSKNNNNNRNNANFLSSPTVNSSLLTTTFPLFIPPGLLFVTDPIQADIVVTNDVHPFRASLLAALAYGSWIVKPSFLSSIAEEVQCQTRQMKRRMSVRRACASGGSIKDGEHAGHPLLNPLSSHWETISHYASLPVCALQRLIFFRDSNDWGGILRMLTGREYSYSPPPSFSSGRERAPHHQSEVDHSQGRVREEGEKREGKETKPQDTSLFSVNQAALSNRVRPPSAVWPMSSLGGGGNAALPLSVESRRMLRLAQQYRERRLLYEGQGREDNTTNDNDEDEDEDGLRIPNVRRTKNLPFSNHFFVIFQLCRPKRKPTKRREDSLCITVIKDHREQGEEKERKEEEGHCSVSNHTPPLPTDQTLWREVSMRLLHPSPSPPPLTLLSSGCETVEEEEEVVLQVRGMEQVMRSGGGLLYAVVYVHPPALEKEEGVREEEWHFDVRRVGERCRCRRHHGVDRAGTVISSPRSCDEVILSSSQLLKFLSSANESFRTTPSSSSLACNTLCPDSSQAEPKWKRKNHEEEEEQVGEASSTHTNSSLPSPLFIEVIKGLLQYLTGMIMRDVIEKKINTLRKMETTKKDDPVELGGEEENEKEDVKDEKSTCPFGGGDHGGSGVEKDISGAGGCVHPTSMPSRDFSFPSSPRASPVRYERVSQRLVFLFDDRLLYHTPIASCGDGVDIPVRALSSFLAKKEKEMDELFERTIPCCSSSLSNRMEKKKYCQKNVEEEKRGKEENNFIRAEGRKKKKEDNMASSPSYGGSSSFSILPQEQDRTPPLFPCCSHTAPPNPWAAPLHRVMQILCSSSSSSSGFSSLSLKNFISSPFFHFLTASRGEKSPLWFPPPSPTARIRTIADTTISCDTNRSSHCHPSHGGPISSSQKGKAAAWLPGGVPNITNILEEVNAAIASTCPTSLSFHSSRSGTTMKRRRVPAGNDDDYGEEDGTGLSISSSSPLFFTQQNVPIWLHLPSSSSSSSHIIVWNFLISAASSKWIVEKLFDEEGTEKEEYQEEVVNSMHKTSYHTLLSNQSVKFFAAL